MKFKNWIVFKELGVIFILACLMVLALVMVPNVAMDKHCKNETFKKMNPKLCMEKPDESATD